MQKCDYIATLNMAEGEITAKWP